MKGFLKNNIEFRRYTAERYADFYKAKAFMLSEILETNRHQFTAQARETLLQYFSSATDWLQEVEKCFIRSGQGASPTDENGKQIIESFIGMETFVHELMQDNPEDFDTRFSSAWIEMRKACLAGIVNAFSLRLSPNKEEAFRLITDFVIGYMSHTMFNLHEIDYLIVERERPFVYVDKLDLTAMEIDQITNPITRWETYKKHGLLAYSPQVKLRAKYMLDDKYVTSYSMRKDAYEKLRCSLEQCDSQFY